MCVIKDVKFPPFSEPKDSYPSTLTGTIDYLCSQFFHPVLLLFLLHTPHYRPIMRRIQLWSCPLLCLSSWTSMLNLSWVRHWIYPVNPEGISEKQIDQISHQMKLKVTVPCHWLYTFVSLFWRRADKMTPFQPLKTLWGSNTLKYTKNDGSVDISTGSR